MESLVLQKGPAALGRVAPLFASWPETMIASALQGQMGSVWRLGENGPALCQNGDFWFATSAKPDMLRAIQQKLNGRFGILAFAPGVETGNVQQTLSPAARPHTRYAMQKGGELFDAAHLQTFINALPKEMQLHPIDTVLYHTCLTQSWSRDFVAQFASARDFANRGLGVVALLGDQIVGGASSYVCFQGGMEIEVDTHRDYRRRGVAAACCASLILNCLSRGLYPSWDAANLASVALAEKLGYRQAGPYPVWHLNDTHEE